jgi:hypothetical protein
LLLDDGGVGGLTGNCDIVDLPIASSDIFVFIVPPEGITSNLGLIFLLDDNDDLNFDDIFGCLLKSGNNGISAAV